MSHQLSIEWPEPQIALLTFADAERQNQLCWAAIAEMADALRVCREQGARVIILASDLEGHWLEHAWLRDLDNTVAGKDTTAVAGGWFPALDELARPEVITIAAVGGDSSGGGAELGWACDFRVAEQQARFSQPEININLTTGIGGCSRLSRLAGRTLTNEMVLLGKAVSARRLYDLGAINRVVPKGAAIATALDWAKQITAKSSAATTGLKTILNASEVLPLDKAMAFEQETFVSLVVSEEARTGMQDAQSQYDQGVSIAELNQYDQ